MANGKFVNGMASLVNGDVDFLTADVRVMLVNGYVFDPADQFVSDGPAAAEISGTGYVAGFAGSGRQAITAKAITADVPNLRVEFDGADLSWPGIDLGEIDGAVIYVKGSSDADSRLLWYVDEGGFPYATNGTTFVLQWWPEGFAHHT